jgi:hypothetical protein
MRNYSGSQLLEPRRRPAHSCTCVPSFVQCMIHAGFGTEAESLMDRTRMTAYGLQFAGLGAPLGPTELQLQDLRPRRCWMIKQTMWPDINITVAIWGPHLTRHGRPALLTVPCNWRQCNTTCNSLRGVSACMHSGASSSDGGMEEGPPDTAKPSIPGLAQPEGQQAAQALWSTSKPGWEYACGQFDRCS